MSFGNMNRRAELVSVRSVTDSEGFSEVAEEVLASFRTYREGRHGSRRWANLAAFTEATDLFRFRRISGITVSPGQIVLCGGERFEILSVEDVKSRGLYMEVLAKKVTAVDGTG